MLSDKLLLGHAWPAGLAAEWPYLRTLARPDKCNVEMLYNEAVCAEAVAVLTRATAGTVSSNYCCVQLPTAAQTGRLECGADMQCLIRKAS
jgi:hypothetical protein